MSPAKPTVIQANGNKQRYKDPFPIKKGWKEPHKKWATKKSGPSQKNRFPNSVGWRQWDDSANQVKKVKGVPASSRRIPQILYHVTRYEALPSIRRHGLDPGFVNSKSGLNAAAVGETKYRLRDANLKAIYLGTSSRPGLSMSSEESIAKGGIVTLTIRVNRDFRLAHMRFSHATGAAAGEIDLHKTGDTVLCFAKIPPENIYLYNPVTRTEMPLPRFKDDFDWRLVAEQPKSGKKLKSLKQVEDEERAKQRRLERLRNMPVPVMPIVNQIAVPNVAPLTFTLPQHMLSQAALNASNSNDSSSSSDEWE